MYAKYMFLLCILVWSAKAQPQIKLFNVKDYGAIADGKTDNREAFMKAWNDTCKWDGNATVLIPQGTYMLNKITFNGPCKGLTNFEIQGVLKAPTSGYSPDKWIGFSRINQLRVGGGGTLDGQGPSAWPARKDCHKDPCPTLPITIIFDFITNGYVHDLHSVNSKNAHFEIFGCQNFTFTKLNISAPKDSPNTDGIKISHSVGINITSVKIGTGDDCIAMISGTKNVHISDVFCGPGHGISVGSIGKSDTDEGVDDIVVKNCTFDGTSDGVRIKTWAAPLNRTLIASNFVYEDIVINNVDHPINIDQEYCPNHQCNTTVGSYVQISNVRYKNIRGSGNTDIAVSLKCSGYKPCQNITVEDINLSRYGGKGSLSNFCSHVNGASYGQQIPPSCVGKPRSA